jgi:hypothetical protein
MMRAGRWETLGAWLGLWTPPRDVEVPPPPSRRTLALAAAGLLALAAVVAFVVAPAVDEEKDRAAAQERAALERRLAARREAQRVQQRPRLGRLPAGASRAAALVAVEDRVLADARDRFLPRSPEADCRPFPPTEGGRRRAATARRAAFDCLAVESRLRGGRTGVPYRAVVDFGAGRYAFCRINPIASEQAVPDPRLVVRLEPPCRDPDRR